MAWKKGTADNYLDFIDKVETFCTKKFYAGNLAAGANTGTGTVYGASATDNSVEETWTLVCTTLGGNGTAIFSVTGSVSGAKADATSGIPYSIPETSFTALNGAVDFAVSDSFTFDTTKPVVASAPVAGANTGDGAVGTITPVDGSPDEVWTLTATSDGPDATFSAVGSDSGAKADLTSEVAYSNGFFSLTITDGTEPWIIGDSFTFSIYGYSQYDVKRGNATGGNLSNDYLKPVQWNTLAGKGCVYQTKSTIAVKTIADVIPAPMSSLNNTDFTISFDVFKASSYAGIAFFLSFINQSLDLAGSLVFIGGAGDILGAFIGDYNVRHTVAASINQWYNVIFSYNRSTSDFVLYLDGSSVSTGTRTGLSNALTSMYVGGTPVSWYTHSCVNAGLKNMQIYQSVKAGGDITTIAAGGTVSGLVHHWLCNEGEGVRYAVDSVGGATYNLDLGPTKKDLILMGKGSGGVSEIYTGIQSYSDAVSKFNVALQGFTGYVPSNTFGTQPGAISTAPAICLQNSSFNYYIHTTPSRIFLFTNVGGNDESAYLGWYIPYFSEDQWGYPMAIGGSATSTVIAGSDVTTSHKAWFNLATTLQMLANGVWGSVNTSTPMSMNNFSGTNHIEDVDGTYPDFEFIPFSTALGLYYGPFEGVSIPVRANTINSGDVLLDAAKAKLVIGDTFRTGQGTIAAIELSGD